MKRDSYFAWKRVVRQIQIVEKDEIKGIRGEGVSSCRNGKLPALLGEEMFIPAIGEVHLRSLIGRSPRSLLTTNLDTFL